MDSVEGQDARIFVGNVGTYLKTSFFQESLNFYHSFFLNKCHDSFFFSCLAPDTDPSLIEEHFKKHGNVKDVAVFKGYAFVQFEKALEGQAAIENENGAMLLGKRIDVKPAKRNTRTSDPPPPAPKEDRRDENRHDNRNQEFQDQGGPPVDDWYDNQGRGGYHGGNRGGGRGGFDRGVR